MEGKDLGNGKKGSGPKRQDLTSGCNQGMEKRVATSFRGRRAMKKSTRAVTILLPTRKKRNVYVLRTEGGDQGRGKRHAQESSL